MKYDLIVKVQDIDYSPPYAVPVGITRYTFRDLDFPRTLKPGEIISYRHDGRSIFLGLITDITKGDTNQILHTEFGKDVKETIDSFFE